MLYEEIITQLKTLGFNGMLQCLNDMEELNENYDLSREKILHALLKSEISYRQTRSFMYRLHLAKFPQIKSLDNFDVNHLPDATILTKSGDLKFIEDHHNMLIIGGSGTGKSHLSLGLAHRALHHNYRVRFYKFTDLARALLIAQEHNCLTNLISRLQRFNLLVMDEFGYLPIDPKASPLLFELFSNLYEKVSVLINTHLTFDEWSNIFGTNKTTKVIVDRFTHHCLVLETGNKSWRLKEGKMA